LQRKNYVSPVEEQHPKGEYLNETKESWATFDGYKSSDP